MADPFTLAAISIGTTLAAGAASAAGAIYQGQAASNMASYQAQVARNNAEIARRNADYETMLGESKAQREGMKTAAERGMIVAGLGASGLDVSSGSAADVQESAKKLGSYNQEVIRNDAARKRSAFLQQSTDYQAESQLYDVKSKYAREGSYFSAAGSLLGTAGSVSEKWYKYQTT